MLSLFEHGLSSSAIPVLGAGGVPLTTGNVFFVDSGGALRADDASNGGADTPFSTIDFAVSQCTANNGDIIIAMPGHTETVSAAGGLDLDIAGITIIGIGTGPDQPTIALDTIATADVDIDAAGVTLMNLHFTSGFADIAIAIDVNADDFTLDGCRFSEAADNQNFLICVQDAAAAGSNRITIRNCYALQDDAANTHFANFAGTGKGHALQRNLLLGDWGVTCLGGGGIVTFCVVTDNIIYNAASDNDACINFAATATGFCARNLVSSAAAAAKITAGDLGICENYGAVNTEDLSGILEPVAT